MYLQQIEFERYQNARMNLNPWNEVANGDEKKKRKKIVAGPRLKQEACLKSGKKMSRSWKAVAIGRHGQKL